MKCRFPVLYWTTWNLCYFTEYRNWIEAVLLRQAIATDPGVSSSIFYSSESNFPWKQCMQFWRMARRAPSGWLNIWFAGSYQQVMPAGSLFIQQNDLIMRTVMYCGLLQPLKLFKKTTGWMIFIIFPALCCYPWQ